MKIQILGTGCPKCTQLAENAKAAIQAAGVDAEIVKITELNEIIDYGVMLTPALAIDGAVKFVGKVAAVAEIQEILNTIKTE